jgi:hypothetical protein
MATMNGGLFRKAEASTSKRKKDQGKSRNIELLTYKRNKKKVSLCSPAGPHILSLPYYLESGQTL